MLSMKTMKNNVYKSLKESDERLGLVLGGGGAKGCYEIGALQAFKACGIQFDCVAGTSIGAIVGAIYATGKDNDFIDFVMDLKPTDIVQDLVIPENVKEAFDKRKIMWKVAETYGKKQGLDVTPLRKTIDKMFDYELFEKSDIDYACMTYNVTNFRAVPWFKNQGITKENAKDVIMASASCFPAFPVQEIEGEQYIDGGYDDNLPVDLALMMDAKRIVAIDVKGVGFYKPKIKKESIVYWEPLVPLGNFLDFRSKEGVRSMTLGYLETMKRLDQMPGHTFTFEKEDFDKMVQFENYLKSFANENGVHLLASVKKKFMGKDIPDLSSCFNKTFVYEIVFEYLADYVKMDPTIVYRFDEFTKEVYKRLQERKNVGPSVLFDFDQLVSNQLFELIKIAYKMFGQKMPSTISELDFVNDVGGIACVWKGLESFLENSTR